MHQDMTRERLLQIEAGTLATIEETRALAGQVRRLRFPDILREHDLPHCRVDTSVQAARSKRTHANQDRVRILERLAVLANGATSDEIEARLEMRHQTASARLHDLEADGLVVRTGRTRRTRSGRLARVYLHRDFAMQELKP